MSKCKLNIYCKSRLEVIENTFNSSDWSGYNEEAYHNHKIYAEFEEHSVDDYPECFFMAEKNKVYFLVYILYSSGGTFGTTHGYFRAVKLCETAEEAKELQRLINESTKNRVDTYHPEKDKILSKIKSMNPHESFSFYDYLGYFESLDDCGIEIIQTRP